MAIQVRRGAVTNLDKTKLKSGEFAYSTDTKQVFIGSGTNAVELAKQETVDNLVTTDLTSTSSSGKVAEALATGRAIKAVQDFAIEKYTPTTDLTSTSSAGKTAEATAVGRAIKANTETKAEKAYVDSVKTYAESVNAKVDNLVTTNISATSASGKAAEARAVYSAMMETTTSILNLTEPKIEDVTRKNNILWKLNKGQSYDFEEVEGNGAQTVPTGAKGASVISYSGRSLRWNQLNSNNCNGGLYKGINFVKNTDGTWTATGTPTDSNTFRNVRYSADEYIYEEGHKYYASSGSDKVCVNLYRYTDTRFNGAYDKKSICTAPAKSGTFDIFRIRIDSDYVGQEINETVFPVLVDLTKLFGSGNEPTSVDDARIKWIDSYVKQHPAYTEGEVIHADVKRIDVTGKNLCSEFTYGKSVNSTTGVVGNRETSAITDYIEIEDGVPYTSKLSIDTLYNYVSFYDANKNYIGRTGASGNPLRNISASQFPGRRYCIICVTENSAVSGVINDLKSATVQLEKGSVATDYSPYSHESITIPTSIRSLDGYGQSNGNKVNEVDFENNIYHKKGSYVNGTWVDDVQEISISNPGYMFEAETGGTIKFVTDNDIAVPNKIEYVTKLDEVN